ncbi:MAG: type II secretion system protein [Planctomycetes bacterium]|nr:type II secretion system protein [Planctomycetota bacterium]
MTLLEVGISLIIVSLTMTTALLLFPVGLKAQQESRYQVIAAAQAQMLVQGALERQQHVTLGSEGAQPWDRPYVNPTVAAPDLDGGINVARWGSFAPLPPEIRERIDSDADEMAAIAADGGQIFYARLDGGDLKLVFAVSGYPQQNALMYHPQIKWPYFDYFPAAFINNGQSDPTIESGWHGFQDSEVRVLSAVDSTGVVLGHANSNDLTRLREAMRLLGMNFDPLVAAPAPLGITPRSQAQLASDYTSDPDRFNARAIVLRFYTFACAATATYSGLRSFWPTPGVYPDTVPAIREFQIANAWMLAYNGYLQLHRPYDLRTPRNYALASMVDAPLFQYDLATDPARDPGASPPNGLMHAWRVLASEPVVSCGNNTHGSRLAWTPVDAGDRSVSSGWNLTGTFDPSERCREVVVWAVDWQSYEDFESAPGAPFDAGLLPRMPTVNPASADPATGWAAGFPDRVSNALAQDNFHAEFPLAWLGPDRSQTVQQSYPSPATGGWSQVVQSFVYQNYCAGPADQNNLASYFIRLGADRDGNGTFDRGPVRRSVRLRATTIARFIAYDPRLYLQFR